MRAEEQHRRAGSFKVTVNHLEKHLVYPFGEVLPAPGEVVELAPGKLWVRMPLPFALDHINLWLLRDEIDGQCGWTLIDTGAGLSETRVLWEQVFARHLDGLPILRVICTHCHPDHFGNADWIAQRFNTRVWMSLGDYFNGRLMYLGALGADTGLIVRHFVAHGLEDERCLAELSQRKANFTATVPTVPPTYRRVVHGETLMIGGEPWQAIAGFGHTAEHIALYGTRSRILVSGDMLLPRISTNIAVHASEPDGNPLQQFMDSLTQFLPLPAETLVLPSHGRPFRKLHVRVQQLFDHHAERLDEVRDLCRAAPTTATHVVPIMFKRKLDTHQMVFALGEALAHLHKLWLDGEVTRSCDARGVYHFSAN